MSTDRYAPVDVAVSDKKAEKKAPNAVVIPLKLFPSGRMPQKIITIADGRVTELNGSQEFDGQPTTTWIKLEDAFLIAGGIAGLTFLVTALVTAIIAH